MSGFFVKRPGMRQISQTLPVPSSVRIRLRGAAVVAAIAAEVPKNCLRVSDRIARNYIVPEGSSPIPAAIRRGKVRGSYLGKVEISS